MLVRLDRKERHCGTLKANGQDVGEALIAEGFCLLHDAMSANAKVVVRLNTGGV